MKWATRKNMKVDRVSSVWLISKFIDHDAEIQYVDDKEIAALTKDGIMTFDAADAQFKHEENISHGKYGEKCTFQIIMDEYNLAADNPALKLMGDIIYAADIGHRRGVFDPREGFGLWALANGFSVLYPDDADTLEKELPVYDALYEYCKEKVNLHSTI